MNSNITTLFMDMAIDRQLELDDEKYAKKALLVRIERSIRRERRRTVKKVRRSC